MGQTTMENASRSVRPDGAAEVSVPDTLVAQIIGRLRAHPHYVKVSGRAPSRESSVTSAIVRAMVETEPRHPGSIPGKPPKISFTQVRIVPDKSPVGRISTSYSRTNQPLDLHTDSSFMAEPHDIVAFQMVRSDDSGGETTMAAVEDIVARLDARTRAILEQPIFPFGKGSHSILWRKGAVQCIRYYRNQIDHACKAGPGLPAAATGAMDRLDDVLRSGAVQRRFKLEAGDILFMDNTRALHGRTGFAPTSERLMYRFRAHAGSLG